MDTFRLRRAALLAAWVATAIHVAAASGQPLGAESPIGPGELRPKENVSMYDYKCFPGRVTAVDKTSVTVQGHAVAYAGFLGRTQAQVREDVANNTRTETGRPLRVILPEREIECVKAVDARDWLTLTHADGTETVVRTADEPQRRFPLARSFGRDGEEAVGSTYLNPVGYRVSDVRVGDYVWLYVDREAGRRVCGMIEISRRPGGSVPPAPYERRREGDTRPRHHERMNALQDWEERRIPLPERFRSLYPDYFASALVPEAPAPRLLPRRIPATTP